MPSEIQKRFWFSLWTQTSLDFDGHIVGHGCVFYISPNYSVLLYITQAIIFNGKLPYARGQYMSSPCLRFVISFHRSVSPSFPLLSIRALSALLLWLFISLFLQGQMCLLFVALAWFLLLDKHQLHTHTQAQHSTYACKPMHKNISW